MKNYKIYTDGACSGNPGPGGWGAVIYDQGSQLCMELSGEKEQTTNNQMEMTAVIEALKHIESGSEVQLYSDSQLVVKGITEWMSGWKKRGWKKASGEEVANKDLWIEMDQAIGLHKSVKIQWVKGHASNKDNNRADELATSFKNKAQ